MGRRERSVERNPQGVCSGKQPRDPRGKVWKRQVCVRGEAKRNEHYDSCLKNNKMHVDGSTPNELWSPVLPTVRGEPGGAILAK